MATITRGTTTLNPVDVVGWSMTRPGQSVVHEIIGDSVPDVTTRAPGLRRGTLRTLWQTHTAALSAAADLAVPGGAWTFTVPERAGLSILAYVVGDVTEAALVDDSGQAWAVDVDVQETT